ncbi:MAG: 7-carboxy-7-deazaguanine synthase QueE [Candidatus Binatia bacterium]
MAKGYISEVFVSFQGEGVHAGRRQLFLRLSGCNLRCRYCDTPDSLERSSRYRVHHANGRVEEGSNPLTAAQLLALTLPLIADGPPVDGVSITGGEPLLQADFLAELLADARLPRPRLLETNGMLPDRLAQVLPVIDVVSMDFKLPSNTGEPAFWEAHQAFLTAAGGKAYVKVLVDAVTAEDDVVRAGEIIATSAPATAVFVQPITNAAGRVELDGRRLAAFYATLRTELADVRVLPQTHKMLGIQ